MVMVVTFSHIVYGRRVPLSDAEGREVTLSVSATDRTSAINSPEVGAEIAKYADKEDVRVRRVE
jgi:hypothetical protein